MHSLPDPDCHKAVTGEKALDGVAGIDPLVLARIPSIPPGAVPPAGQGPVRGRYEREITLRPEPRAGRVEKQYGVEQVLEHMAHENDVELLLQRFQGAAGETTPEASPVFHRPSIAVNAPGRPPAFCEVRDRGTSRAADIQEGSGRPADASDEKAVGILSKPSPSRFLQHSPAVGLRGIVLSMRRRPQALHTTATAAQNHVGLGEAKQLLERPVVCADTAPNGDLGSGCRRRLDSRHRRTSPRQNVAQKALRIAAQLTFLQDR